MFCGSHDGLMIDGLASEPQSAVRRSGSTIHTTVRSYERTIYGEFQLHLTNLSRCFS